MMLNNRGNLKLKLFDTTGRGIFAADGSIRATIVDGTTPVGVHAADGSLNIRVVTESEAVFGVYDRSGAMRVIPASTQRGYYGPNGAVYAEGIGAHALIGSEPDGLAYDGETGTLVIRDTVTPANNFDGLLVNKFTVVGTLTGSLPTFDSSNYATLATSAFPWSNSQGTIYVRAKMNAALTATHVAVAVHDGTTNNRHNIRFATGPILSAIVTSGGTSFASGLDDPVTETDWNTAAFRYQADNMALSVNGAAVNTDLSGSPMPPVTLLRLGNVGSSTASPLNGKIGSVLYLPVAKSNAALQAGPPSWA